VVATHPSKVNGPTLVVVDGAIELLHKLRTIVLVETSKAPKTQTFQQATKERSGGIPMKMHPVGVDGLGTSNGRPLGQREINILHNL
jgi:hypothetical protein